MAYPQPPSISSTRSSIRQRSGAFSRELGTTEEGPQSSAHQPLAAANAGADPHYARPTVTLVQKKPHSRVPSLPILQPAPGYPQPAANALLLQLPPSDSRPFDTFGRHQAPADCDPAPFVPADVVQPPSSRSLGSLPASASDIPLLAQPSQPDYEAAHDALPHLHHAHESSPGPLARVPSSSSTATFPMRPKPPPKAPKRATAFVSLSAADRLTQKFPISKTVRGLALDGSLARDAARSVMATPESIGSSLERSRGLGMDRPNRWTPHKWWLFLSVCTVFATGAAGLVCALLTWFRAWDHADVFFVADYDLLVLITLASSLLLFTFIVGMTGTLLNSRPILAMYALLLWPAFIALLAVGYTSYKRSAFALDRKLNAAWSKYYSPAGRLAVQDALWCCGYNSPLHEAAASGRCFARAALPGCKGRLLRVERALLQRVYAAAFGAVPLHIANIVAALLCANHVTRTFGKGITPRQYRLCGADVQSDAEKILGTMETLGPALPPAVSRPSSFVSYREDREEPPAPSGIPAALRPGIPSGLWRRHKHG